MAKRGRPRHPDILTPREWEVLALLREGLTNEQIAERLATSERTARYHVSEILSKLGVSTRQEAAAWQPEERRPWWAIALGLPFRKSWLPVALVGAVLLGSLIMAAVIAWGISRTRGSEDVSAVASTATEPTNASSATIPVPLAVGKQHACVVIGGGVTCWGLFGSGYVPGKVDGLRAPVVAVAAGTNDVCALLETGTVQCWGDDRYGQLGDGLSGVIGNGADVSSSKPVDVFGLRDVTVISAGAGHTCALTQTGGVKCWGNNAFGQVGDGTTDVRTKPVDVGGLTSGVQAIAAGGNFTCALMTSAAVKCWGSNAAGQLGVALVAQKCGSPPLVFSCSPIPVDVGGLSGVHAIAVSGFGQHACALTSAARMECWGSNIAGQLGISTSELCTDQPCSSTPRDVGLDNVAAIGLGTTHTCAAVSTGGASCWGDNNAGQLGDGTREQRRAPAAVQALSAQVGTISAGELDTCVYIAAGDVRCWGADGADELGDGTAGDPICGCSMTPVSVYGLVPDENARTTPPDQLAWPRTPFGTLVASSSPLCGDQATADQYGVPRMLEFPSTERLGLEAAPYPYVEDQLVPFTGLGRRPTGWELSERPPLYLGVIGGLANAWLGPQELFLRRLDKPDLMFRYSAEYCPQESDFRPGPSFDNVKPRANLKLPAALPHVVEHRHGDYISADKAIEIASQRDQMNVKRAGLPQAAAAQVRVVWAELGTADEFPSDYREIVQINIPSPPVWLVVLSIGDLAGPLRPGHPGLARYYVIDSSTGFINIEGGCCIGVTFGR